MLRRVPEAVFSPLRRALPALEPGSLRHRMLRQMLGVVRHRGLPTDSETFTLTDNEDIRLVNADSYIIECSYWFGERNGYEPETLRWWREYCRRSTSILELGANIGYFTVQGAKAAPGARYVAVEPHPDCASVCRENVRINGLSNVEVVEAAAVATLDTPSVLLRTPGDLSRDHYRAPCTGYVGKNEMHSDDADDASWGTITVAAATVRDLLAGMDLLKMDIEGQEFTLLSSVGEEIISARPTIFVEVLDDTPKLRSFISELASATDYRCLVPTLDRLIPLATADIPSVSLTDTYGTRDLILTCDVVPEWLGEAVSYSAGR